MDWIQSVQCAVNYIEEHITEDLTPETVAKSVYSSNAHFQRIFGMITGITIGDYIRNRRLSLAGKEIAESEQKIIDVALKYHYDSAASFTKAYLRFHGVTPSESKKNGTFKSFAPLTIQIHIRGGFDMQRKIIHNIPVFPYDGNNAAFFVTLLEAVLRGIGEECDKPKLIALSGEGNRFCWDDKAWVFGNEVTESINETPFETENRVLSAIGWKAKYISVQHDRDGNFLNTDLAQIRRDFVDSIDRGFPVIIRYIRHDDCDLNVFFGYEDNGQRIIGYDYNAIFHVGEDQTVDNSTPTAWEEWENNLSGYILLGNKIDTASERCAALAAFHCISAHARKTDEIRGKKVGFAAWESFLYHLEHDNFSELPLSEVQNRFAIYCDALCQIYARSEALPYYRKLADEFPEWKDRLDAAADALDRCASYAGYLWSRGFSFNEAGYEKFRSMDERKILADAGRDAMKQDMLAVEIFENILANENML